MVASTERHALALSCWLAALVAVVSPSQELMKQLTTGFGKALNECKNELNIADHIMQDFMNYWREDYQLLNRDFGCAIMCMATKHDLVDLDGGIHHENAHAFTKKHGADDDQAKQLVTMIHDCHQSIVDRSDPCLAALEVAKCFKTKIHELKWAPSMEEIVAEVMSDVQPNPQ